MIKYSIGNDDIVKIPKTTEKNLSASDEEILRNRIFIVEQAVKNRVQYNELMQFRLKSDKIEITDLSKDIIDQFLNDQSIARLEALIDAKVSREELEAYLKKEEFTQYKAFISAGLSEIRDTLHEHHDECIRGQGYLKGLLENKIDDDEFALLENRVSILERNGVTGGGGGTETPSVDLTPINNRLYALEQEDERINSQLQNKVDHSTLSNYRHQSVLIDESDLSEGVRAKLNKELPDFVERSEFNSSIESLGNRLDGVYTKHEIDAKLDEISTEGTDIDLSAYVQNERFESEISNLTSQLSEKAVKSEVNASLLQKANVDHTHSSYAKKTDVDTLTERVTTLESSKANVEHTHDEYLSSAELDAVESSVSELTTKVTQMESSVSRIDTISSEVEGLKSSKADTSHTHSDYATKSELATKAEKSHTHSEYATTSALNSGLAGKANVVHTHEGYVETSVVESLKELVNSMKSEIDTLKKKVALLESYHTDGMPDENIEWEVKVQFPSSAPTSGNINIYSFPEMSGKTFSLEDFYGDDYSGTKSRVKCFNCGTDNVPKQPPVEIPNDVINPDGDLSCQFRNFAYDGEGTITYASYPVGEAVYVKIVKYREEV